MQAARCKPVGEGSETLAREASASTAIGLGIALPHPASLLISSEADSLVAVAYPRYALA